MLLQLVAENILSFKDVTEFNTFPSSKSKNHNHHKVVCGSVTALRMSALYGANGAGKSNLIKILSILKDLIVSDSFKEFPHLNLLPFRLDASLRQKPSGIAIEFACQKNIFYYHIEFLNQEVLTEELFLSEEKNDKPIFTRKNNNIHIDSAFLTKGLNKNFINVLDRIIRPDMLLLSFLGKYYSKEISIAAEAYSWFKRTLKIVQPQYATGTIPFFLDTDKDFSAFVNSLIPEANTGIHRLSVKDEIINDKEAKISNLNAIIKKAKEIPGIPFIVELDETEANLVFENNKIHLKTLVSLHKNHNGSEVEIPFALESDGTRRMVEYMPLFYSTLKRNSVYIIDEIERSIHPILIKNIMRMLSTSKQAKGQLIFSTHESALLDQTIFRPDEIWFAQKDINQATQLYPLSDYNIHKTANIENGYLNGRYGGIPFLSNLKDLNW